MISTPPEVPAEKKHAEPLNAMRSLMLVGEIGWIIALPAVGLGLLGRYADLKFGLTPWLFILGLLIAFTVSTFAVYRSVKSALSL